MPKGDGYMFIGRERELASLKEFYDKDGIGMTVIYGRRRIGKSTLIAEFIKDKKTIFYTATKVGKNRNLELFSRQVLDLFMPGVEEVSFNTIEAVFDFIDKNMYSILINNTQKYNSDIVWFNYYNYYSKKHFINSSIIKNNDLYDLSSSDKIKFAKNLFYQYKMDAHVWAKLYKRSIFNNIKFPYGKLFEDIFVLLPILSNAKIISTIPDCLYFYRNRSESIVNQYFKQNIIKNIDFIESRIILAINYKNHFPNIPESNLFLFDVLKTAFDTLYKFDNYHTQQKIITHLMSKLLKEKLPVKIKLRIIRRYFYALFKEINYVYSYKK